MDTITHGIAGALIGKAVFRGEDMFAFRPMTRGRIVTWSLMLGAIFPDSDVVRDIFSHDKLLMITWHRSITHSLVMMPLWALLLAWITSTFAKSRKWEAPSFAALTGIYVVGILSHILLDLVTSFGTMIWSPLDWSRPAWDMIFILDFTLTGIFLVPQLLAWVYEHPEKMRKRALGIWVVFMPVPFLVAHIGEAAGAPISAIVVLGTMFVLTLIFLLPALQGWGVRITHESCNRAGLAAALVYTGLAFFAHQIAFARIVKFSQLDQLHPESIGALPFPPSLWQWDGLVRTERGVYELRMDLSNAHVREGDLLVLEHRYFPDAPPNSYIEAARRLPEVQKVFWFARFPVTRFHKEGAEAVVEISDLRFARTQPGRPPAFTYRVRFAADGNVISQGWVTR